MNRDTLYSSGLRSRRGVGNDHAPRSRPPLYVTAGDLRGSVHGARSLRARPLCDRRSAGRHALRDAARPHARRSSARDDMAAAHQLQDAIIVEQPRTGTFEVPDWDSASRNRCARNSLLYRGSNISIGAGCSARNARSSRLPPAEPGAGIPEVERDRGEPGRRLFRAAGSRDRATVTDPGCLPERPAQRQPAVIDRFVALPRSIFGRAFLASCCSGRPFQRAAFVAQAASIGEPIAERRTERL